MAFWKARLCLMCALPPFLWDNDEELQAFLKSEAAQQWFDEAAAATGVRVFYAEGRCTGP